MAQDLYEATASQKRLEHYLDKEWSRNLGRFETGPLFDQGRSG